MQESAQLSIFKGYADFTSKLEIIVYTKNFYFSTISLKNLSEKYLSDLLL